MTSDTRCPTCLSDRPEVRLKVNRVILDTGRAFDSVAALVPCDNDIFHRCGTCGSTRVEVRKDIKVNRDAFGFGGLKECDNAKFHGQARGKCEHLMPEDRPCHSCDAWRAQYENQHTPPAAPSESLAVMAAERERRRPISTHCPKHGRKWYRCCDPESNVEMHNREKPAAPDLLKAAAFNELTERVTKLKLLLDDPQPGLFTWCALYAEQMKFIAAYWENN